MRKHLKNQRFLSNLGLKFALLPLLSFSVINSGANALTAKMDTDYTLSNEGYVVEKEVIEIDHKAPVIVCQNAILASKTPRTTEVKKPVSMNYRFEKPVNLNGKRIIVLATAYSSTVDQCDASPFITASGSRVHDGTLAANFLPFGTKVKIPEVFGDRVFVVEDRMRDNHKVDVWYPSRGEALQFGARRVVIEIL